MIISGNILLPSANHRIFLASANFSLAIGPRSCANSQTPPDTLQFLSPTLQRAEGYAAYSHGRTQMPSAISVGKRDARSMLNADDHTATGAAILPWDL